MREGYFFARVGKEHKERLRLRAWLTWIGQFLYVLLNWFDPRVLAHQSDPYPPLSPLFGSNLGCCSTIYPLSQLGRASVTLQDKLSHPLQVTKQQAWGPGPDPDMRTCHEVHCHNIQSVACQFIPEWCSVLSNWELFGSALVVQTTNKKKSLTLDSSSHVQIAQVCKQHKLHIVYRSGQTSSSLLLQMVKRHVSS